MAHNIDREIQKTEFEIENLVSNLDISRNTRGQATPVHRTPHSSSRQEHVSSANNVPNTSGSVASTGVQGEPSMEVTQDLLDLITFLDSQKLNAVSQHALIVNGVDSLQALAALHSEDIALFQLPLGQRRLLEKVLSLGESTNTVIPTTELRGHQLATSMVTPAQVFLIRVYGTWIYFWEWVRMLRKCHITI